MLDLLAAVTHQSLWSKLHELCSMMVLPSQTTDKKDLRIFCYFMYFLIGNTSEYFDTSYIY
jgi:hypothetical protein